MENIEFYFLELRKCIKSFENEFARSHLPLFLSPDSKNKADAIASLTRIFYLDKPKDDIAGVICVRSEVIQAAENLNKAKNEFKKAVIEIRDEKKLAYASSKYISKLLQEHTVADGSNVLDLKRCYAHVKILPRNLQHLSYTWATSHKSIKRITIHNALNLASELTSPEASEIAVELLNSCDINEPLVQVKVLPPQLRANYAFYDEGELHRGSTPLSGVALCEQEVLPEIIWRDMPDVNNLPPRISRQSKIRTEPFIKSLSLYRYV